MENKEKMPVRIDCDGDGTRISIPGEPNGRPDLQINCALCDARRVQEETLAAYENIVINCATLITDQRSQALLDRYGVKRNCSTMEKLESEVQLRTVNGSEEMGPHSAPDKPTCLVVNGKVTVLPGAEDTLAGYVSVIVNGKLLCPESLSGHAANIRVSGSMRTYPDDCAVLGGTLVLDRTFPLRARQGGRYFVTGGVVVLAPDIGFEKLAQKSVQFVTREVLVAESLVEAAMPLFDEKAEIVIVPDGCAYVDDDAVLDRSLVRRYGNMLYIDGDLEVAESAGEVLAGVKYLKVDGDVAVPAALEDAFHAIGAEYDGLTVLTGEEADEEDGEEKPDDGRVVINAASYQL